MKKLLGKDKITIGCLGISYKADVDDLRNHRIKNNKRSYR